jgi:hypothetical protein
MSSVGAVDQTTGAGAKHSGAPGGLAFEMASTQR